MESTAFRMRMIFQFAGAKYAYHFECLEVTSKRMTMKNITKITLGLLFTVLFGYFALSSEQLFYAGQSIERKLAGLSVKSIKIDEGEVAYLEGGKGDVIVFLHGFGANKDNWVRLAKHLKDDYSIIAIDLPGFGDSFKKMDLKYGVESQVRRVNELINQLGINKFYIAGNSMGGYIAGNYAIKYPERVTGLWLLNALGVESADESEMFKDISNNKKPIVLVQDKNDLQKLTSFVFQSPPYIPEFVISELAKKAEKDYQINQKIFYEIHKQDNNKVKFASPLDRGLAKFSKPVLITWGKQDRVLHYSAAKVLSQIAPQAEMVVMDDIGHLPMIEAPKATAKQFISFSSRN
ncbi:alpha/beta hydrolase [Pseudoalteromonas phenolica]|uniref:Alpha/beta hydrolase n=2 Tax=Pseudoalteromonas phenolica TaxID=161398 RepID=A0A4Q7IRG6_9GAMM|nr:alpha/beta hydrolase [Pseudoalteromonas phenolica]